MSISNYLELELLDAVFNNGSFAVAQPYVSLHTDDPGETGANEVSSGITNVSNTKTTTTTTIWLSGGTAGSSYTASNRVVTAEGRTEDRTILIRVEER